MIERSGDMFTSDAPYLAHGVNCMGLMGAGVAKIVRDKYPRTYARYNDMCQNNLLLPGEFFVYGENGKFVVNLASQKQPGADAQYDWLFSSVYRFAALASLRDHGNLVAIPRIGCGIGGLEWKPVRDILFVVEDVTDMEFEVWTL